MRHALIALLCLATSPLTIAAEPTPVQNPEEVLARLVEANRRFAEGKVVRPHQTMDRRAQVAQEQKPTAIVLTCADSR